MILQDNYLKIVEEISNKIEPKIFWEPKLGKNITLYFVDSKTFLKNKKYQNQFLELLHLLNEDNAMVLENIKTGEWMVIAFPLDAKKILISSLFSEENYEKIEEIKNNFQKEINEYLLNI